MIRKVKSKGRDRPSFSLGEKLGKLGLAVASKSENLCMSSPGSEKWKGEGRRNGSRDNTNKEGVKRDPADTYLSLNRLPSKGSNKKQGGRGEPQQETVFTN